MPIGEDLNFCLHAILEQAQGHIGSEMTTSQLWNQQCTIFIQFNISFEKMYIEEKLDSSSKILNNIQYVML